MMKPALAKRLITAFAALSVLVGLVWLAARQVPAGKGQEDPIEQYRARGDEGRLFTALYQRGMELSGEGKYIDAMLVFSEAAAIEEKIADPFVKGELYEQIGSIYSIYNDYEKALNAFEKAVAFYKRAGDARPLTRAYFELGAAAWRSRRYEQGEMWLNYALRTSRASGDRAVEQRTLADLIMLHGGRGRLSKACELIEDYDRDFGVGKSSNALHSASRNIFFLDASLGWKLKRVEYAIDGTNLLNVREYGNHRQSAMEEVEYSAPLRPAAVMLRVKFSL